MILLAFFTLLASFNGSLFEMNQSKDLLGIESERETSIEEEIIIEKCLEGSELITLHQNRVVEVEPGKEIWMTQICLGHEEEISIPEKEQFWFDNSQTAKKLQRDTKNRLDKDPLIQQSIVWVEGSSPYRVKIKYWHRDDCEACTKCKYHQNSEKSAGEWEKKYVKRCKGHREDGPADTHTYQKAKENQRKQEEQLQKASALASHKTYLGQHRSDGKFRLDKEIRHKNDCSECNHFTLDEVWVRPPVEKSDTWVTDNPEKAAQLEKNSRCKMIGIKDLEKLETREIHGLSITRNVWGRDLILDCQIDSVCNQLRRDGCAYLKEECLKKDELGRCIAVEKSYDCGKVPGYYKLSRTFKKGKIWGLNGEFDPEKKNYDKKSDFPVMASGLSSVMGLFAENQQISADSLKDPDLSLLYQGKSYRCHCSFQEQNPFDCCEKNFKDSRCRPEELELAQLRDNGRCHFIGSKLDPEGNTEHVYCCFEMKIARILQEQLRGKLGFGWGTADDPDCRGLTQNEVQKIPFEHLELSETYDDYQANGEEMSKFMQKKIQSYLEGKKI